MHIRSFRSAFIGWCIEGSTFRFPPLQMVTHFEQVAVQVSVQAVGCDLNADFIIREALSLVFCQREDLTPCVAPTKSQQFSFWFQTPTLEASAATSTSADLNSFRVFVFSGSGSGKQDMLKSVRF